jgi:hypothetical protein
MSGDARGQFGADLLFRGGTGGTRVYRPADRTKINQATPSAAQTAVRTRWNAALTAWRALTPSERETWNQTATADRRAVNGWNLFLAAWARGEVTPPLPPPSTYVPPPATAFDFPGTSWVTDTGYTPPSPSAFNFPGT